MDSHHLRQILGSLLPYIHEAVFEEERRCVCLSAVSISDKGGVQFVNDFTTQQSTDSAFFHRILSNQ